MKQYIKGASFIIGACIIFGYMMLSNDFQRSFNAKELDLPSAYTSDLPPTEDTDNKQITLHFNEENNNEPRALEIILNGKPYVFSPTDYIDGVLTMTVPKAEASLIEFSSSSHYFEPSYILCNEQGDDSINDFNINAFFGYAKDLISADTVDENGQDFDPPIFKHEDIPYVSITSFKPMTVIFYMIDDDRTVRVYDHPIKISALSERDHRRRVRYLPIRYYPGDSIPTIADIPTSSLWNFISIDFNAKETIPPGPEDPDPGNPENPEPEKPDFVDRDGNSYEKKDVTIKIEELKNYSNLEKVLKRMKEFKDIPNNQISYIKTSSTVNNMYVEPYDTYDLVLPYPKGTTKESDFVIFQTSSQIPDHADINKYTAENDGLHMKVHVLTDFAICWKTNNSEDPPKEDPSKDNPSSNEDPTIDNGFTNNDDSSNQVKEVFANQNNNVQTGDSSTISIWIILLLLAISTISYQAYKINRSNKT